MKMSAEFNSPRNFESFNGVIGSIADAIRRGHFARAARIAFQHNIGIEDFSEAVKMAAQDE